jgi:hypothetical protein
MSGNVIAINDVLGKCREYFPQYHFATVPGQNPPSIKPGFRTTDNSRSKTLLGIKYMDMGQTFKDSVVQASVALTMSLINVHLTRVY